MTVPVPGRGPVFFTVVVPVFDPPLDLLDQAVASVVAQTHRRWELVAVDDCSENPAVRDLLRSWAARDDRIRVVERSQNGHIAAASNDGLREARGDFVALLDHDDLLAPHALARNAEAIEAHDDVDYLYSDEDHVDLDGRHFKPFAKPDWSPERLRGQNYANHLSVLRTSLVRELGGFREGFDGSQDHDLVLRVGERARRVVHVPEVLYHWRTAPSSVAADPDAKPYAVTAGQRAVEEHLARVGVEARVTVNATGQYVLHRRLPPERRVSVVIPTIGSAGTIWGRRRVFVVEAVRSLLAKTSHENLEVVVVYDPPTPQEVLDELVEIAGEQLVLVPFREKFNYSRKMNFGVLASTGDRIVLLNDDTEARDHDWVVELLAPLEEPDVGLTGAFLYYGSNSLQHAGIAMTPDHYLHPFVLLPDDDPGPFKVLTVSREVSGVTGACVGIRRETYLEVGGLTEELPENFNDVDLGYKVRHLGMRVLVMPRCRLYHFETQTRTNPVHGWELRRIRRRWGRPADRDAFTPDYWNTPEPGVGVQTAGT